MKTQLSIYTYDKKPITELNSLVVGDKNGSHSIDYVIKSDNRSTLYGTICLEATFDA